MTENKYWKTLDKCTRTAKEKILSQCRIREICLTPMRVIGGKCYSNNPKNMNNINKEINDLVSVIITMVTNISGGNTVFYEGVKNTDITKISHVLNHLHGRIIMGPFERFFHEVYLWRGQRAAILFTLLKNVYFIRHGDPFYNRYINLNIGTKYLDYNVMGVKPKQFSQNH